MERDVLIARLVQREEIGQDRERIIKERSTDEEKERKAIGRRKCEKDSTRTARDGKDSCNRNSMTNANKRGRKGMGIVIDRKRDGG